jgi:hypothetical protein
LARYTLATCHRINLMLLSIQLLFKRETGLEGRAPSARSLELVLVSLFVTRY